MARVISTEIPGELALAIVIDRARTYLLRARAAGQRARINQKLSWYKHNAFTKQLAENHEFDARQNRHQARLMLLEAERIAVDRRAYGKSTPKLGARLLDGANFLFWPQYKRHFHDGQDYYLKGEFNARRKPE